MQFLFIVALLVGAAKIIQHWLDNHPKVPDSPASLVIS